MLAQFNLMQSIIFNIILPSLFYIKMKPVIACAVFVLCHVINARNVINTRHHKTRKNSLKEEICLTKNERSTLENIYNVS